MDTSFVGATDPTPYVTAAYALGALGFFGFFAWTALEQKRLRQLLVAVRKPQGK